MSIKVERSYETNQFLYSLFSAIVGAWIYIVLCLARLGLEGNNVLFYTKSIGLLNLVLFLPCFLRALTSKIGFNGAAILQKEGSLLFICILVLTGFAFIIPENAHLSLAPIPLSLLLIAFSMYHLGAGNLLSAKTLTAVLVSASTLGIWIACFALNSAYHSALYLENLAANHMHPSYQDTLFHTCIANMLRYYNVVSTGFDGTPFYPYYVGSHWTVAHFSKLLEIDCFTFYLHGFLLLFVPLFLKSVLTFAYELKCLLWNSQNALPTPSLLILCFGMTGIVIEPIRNAVLLTSTPFYVESYCISMLLFFLMLTIVVEGTEAVNPETNSRLSLRTISYYTLIAIAIAAITITKVSTVAVAFVTLGYLFLRLHNYRKPANFAFLVFCFLISISIYMPFQFSMDCTLAMFPYLSYFVKPQMIPLHIIFYYFWTWLLGILYIVTRKFIIVEQSNQIKILLETLLLLAMVSSIPSFCLRFPGAEGTTGYFSEPQYWLGLAVFVGVMASDSFQFHRLKNAVKPVQIIVYALATTSITLLTINVVATICKTEASIGKQRRNLARLANNLNPCFALLDGIEASKADHSRTAKTRTALTRLIYQLIEPELGYRNTSTHHLFQRLHQIATTNTTDRKKTLLYIPRTNTLFWQALPCEIVPFLGPAIGELAMLAGVPFSDCKCIYYSYYIYKQPEKPDTLLELEPKNLCLRAKSRGYSKVYFFAQSSKEDKLIDCYP